MAKSKTNNPGDPIVIKKYANRRLYNTQTSSYITLDFLADMTRHDQDFIVVDAKTGEASMDNFRKNQKQFQEAVEGALNKNPLGQMAVKNQKQFQEALENALKASPLAGVFEKALSLGHNGGTDDEDKAQGDVSDKDAEIRALKQQLADIQSKIDKLDS